ncbi:MAG: SDR family oxidoreductase [Clostridia bacterium]|nr:SDR family oxidoreductase [Clostridia bacterium]
MSKTVIITGASRGIGRETALAFAGIGCSVAINYNSSEEAAIGLLEELRRIGAQSIAIKADVSDRRQVDEMFGIVNEQLGSVDVLINNAGISQQKLFTDVTEQEWDRMFGVNVKGVFNCCQAALGAMIPRHSGSIINISSMWGQVGASCEVHYSAAKAAVIGLTRALAKEVGPSGVRVNCIAPGVIDTDMCACLRDEDIKALRNETPLGRIGRTSDIAAAALFLASEDAGFITGQVLGVNGGMVI